jgi:hypothetical protein
MHFRKYHEHDGALPSNQEIVSDITKQLSPGSFVPTMATFPDTLILALFWTGNRCTEHTQIDHTKDSHCRDCPDSDVHPPLPHIIQSGMTPEHEGIDRMRASVNKPRLSSKGSVEKQTERKITQRVI